MLRLGGQVVAQRIRAATQRLPCILSYTISQNSTCHTRWSQIPPLASITTSTFKLNNAHAAEESEDKKTVIPALRPRVNQRLFAIVGVGGKQYKVTEGDVIVVNRLQASIGSHIDLIKVLMIGSKDWTVIGTPLVPGFDTGDVQVNAVVTSHFRGPKLVVFKKKRRKGYARKRGHRQEYTSLAIKKIICPDPSL